MQQGLPHVQRQRDPLDLDSAFWQGQTDVAGFQRWAKGFPTALDIVGFDGHPGDRLHLLQQLRAIVVKLRQHQTQPADQQRHNNYQNGACG
ncbi:hypothetical protein D3C75_1039680 [compost metagenome]